MIAFLLFACSGSDTTSTSAEQPSQVVDSTGQKAQEARLKATLAKSQNSTAKPAAEVTFAGTIAYSGSASGSIELEVLDNSSGEPRLMGRQQLKELGSFSIDIKSESSELTLMAYLDLTGDKISDDDPRGYLKISDAKNSVEGLEVTILDLDALEQKKDGKESKKDDSKEDKKDTEKKGKKGNKTDKDKKE